MLPEILLSISAASLIGFILLCEWIAMPESAASAPSRSWAAYQRADLFLAACFGVCLAVIWLPFLFQ